MCGSAQNAPASLHRLKQEGCSPFGQSYRRAYFDDGTPLGTAGGDECRMNIVGRTEGGEWRRPLRHDPHDVPAAIAAGNLLL